MRGVTVARRRVCRKALGASQNALNTSSLDPLALRSQH